MLRSCWRSAVSMSITPRSGAGCNITALSWSSDCEGISSRQTSLGEWTKPTSARRVAGATCTGPSIPGEPPSISCCQRFATPMLPSGCFARRSAIDPNPQPRVINTDLAPIYSSAIRDTKKEGTLRNHCRHRPVQYLNNILEQDHRAIKRRVNAKQGFREFQAARRTIQGYEAIHMIRKGQARWVAGDDLLRQIQFIDNLFELAA